MVFEKKIFAQNGAKIILNMIQGTKMVFYYRIQELLNPTKLNLIIYVMEIKMNIYFLFYRLYEIV